MHFQQCFAHNKPVQMLLQYFIRSRDDMKSCEKQRSTHHRREQVGEFRPHPLALFIHPPLHCRCIILDGMSGRMSKFSKLSLSPMCATLSFYLSAFSRLCLELNYTVRSTLLITTFLIQFQFIFNVASELVLIIT